MKQAREPSKLATYQYLLVFSGVLDVSLMECLVGGKHTLSHLNLFIVDISSHHGTKAQNGSSVYHLMILISGQRWQQSLLKKTITM